MIIRFPPSANLVTPMATALPWWKLLLRRWFGHKRRANVAHIRIERARRQA